MTDQVPMSPSSSDRSPLPPSPSADPSALQLAAQTIVPQLKGLSIYLIGMMGSGKSTLGKQLASVLGYRFLDTDALIEQAAKQDIAQIFAESGETAFRQLETQVLSQVAAYKKTVIATGGGIVLERQNWNFLHYGVSVWLNAPAAVLYARLKGDRHRPLLQTDDPEKTLQTILNQRKDLYAQADVCVAMGLGDRPADVLVQILNAIQSSIKPEQVPPQPGEFEIRYDA